jgi:hypothetical protein
MKIYTLYKWKFNGTCEIYSVREDSIVQVEITYCTISEISVSQVTSEFRRILRNIQSGNSIRVVGQYK